MMIDGAVVPPPEGYHSILGNAIGWFRSRRGVTVGVTGRKQFAGKVVGLTAAMREEARAEGARESGYVR